MDLYIFDIDKTIINGDSNELWHNFLESQNLLTDEEKKQAMVFAEKYRNGILESEKHLAFTISLVNKLTLNDEVKTKFFEQYQKPIIYEDILNLIYELKEQGNYVLLSTGSLTPLVEKLASFLNVGMISSCPEFENNKLTGRLIGEINFIEGKVINLKKWLKSNPNNFNKIHFFSDSIHDLPLLKFADFPNVVNPDHNLLDYAKKLNWPIYSFSSLYLS